MINRRLNKKVALIGSVITVFITLAAILIILQLSGDPQEFIKDAEYALQAARRATDEQSKQQNYDKAESSFREAYARAKTDSLRQEVLFKMVDMYLEVEDKKWPFILGCWDEIIRINPNNAKARYGRLKYFYILSDSSVGGPWQEVQKQATEFLTVVEDKDLLLEDTDKWDVFETEQTKGQRRLGPYLYLLRGRAALEMASMGAVTNRDETFSQAIDDLNKVLEYEPNDIDAYWYLAMAKVTRGEILASRSGSEERDKAVKEVTAILEKAVQVAKNEPRAYINLLSLKLMLTKDEDSAKQKEHVEALEPEYLSLVSNFDKSPEAFAAMSQFYSVYSSFTGPRMGSEKLDRSIEAVEQAIKLDEENVLYSINAANLYYRKFSLFKQKSQVEKAIETAKYALTLPDAQGTPGPRHRAKITNRFMICAFLANCYIEQILEHSESASPSQTTVLMKGAEQAVHEMEQIFGSDEEPIIIKWKGMLELAKGNKETAVKHLYSAYEKLKALKPPEPPWPRDNEFSLLSYTLAKIFKDTPEVGAVADFLVSALYSGIGEIKPEARLNYVDVILKFGNWSDALHNINAFEDYFGSTDRSRRLRIKSYIGSKQFSEAEKELASFAQNDPNTIKLRLNLVQTRIRDIQLKMAQKKMQENSDRIPLQTELDQKEPVGLTTDIDVTTEDLNNYRNIEIELLEKLLGVEPNSVSQNTIVGICRNCIAQGRANQAENLVDKYLEHFPDDSIVLVYKQLLSEPDPENISEQRFKEIEEQVLLNIANPVRRAAQLGIFYRRYNETEKAIRNLNRAVETGISQRDLGGDSTLEYVQIAAGHLLDIALFKKDWELAEKITKMTSSENLDNCHGRVFKTRLAMAKGDFKNALTTINECLEERPVFSYAFMLRSEINSALGDEHASMEDIRKAASLNPLDGIIAKASANVLYNRNQKLGDNVTSAQVIEVRTALERAISLNPGDLSLLSLYAEYIAPVEPMRALAIRQDLQSAAPTIENALMLGQLATQVAVEETNTKLKEVIFGIAASAFEQAKKIDPNDMRMLYYYAEYFRARGQDEKATALLQESQDQNLLWNHYFQQGRYNDAGTVLQRLYDNGSKDVVVLRGLLLVAEKTKNKEALKKYSSELIALEDTVENNLIQIEAFLRAGLIKEAEYKLQSFKEKYPSERKILLLEGWLLMRQGQLQKALDLTNRNLQTDRNNPVAWRLRGEINFLLANYDKAINDLRESKLLSDEPLTRISLAKAYISAERYEDAITELNVMIKRPGIQSEARLLLEHIYSRLDRKPALKKFYDETLEKFPESVQWLNRAGAFAIKTGDFDKAEQLYQKAYMLKSHENSPDKDRNQAQDALYTEAFDGYMNALILGAGEQGKGNWNPRKLDRVYEECGKHLDSSFASVAYLRMAQAKLKLGDKTAAVEYCHKAVDKAGQDEKLASEVLLRMLLMLGSEEVLEYCQVKLATNPDSIAANFAMFNLSKINEKYDKAIDYIQKCISLTDPESPRGLEFMTRKADVLLRAYEKSSDKNYLTAAITVYESLLDKMPNNTIILNDLAYFLAENNERLTEALQYAKRALDEQPNNPGYLDTYAYVLHKQGKNSQAVEYVTASLQQYQQNNVLVPAMVYEHKGLIKEALGIKDEALDAYRQALEAGEDGLSQKTMQRMNEAIERLSQ